MCVCLLTQLYCGPQVPQGILHDSSRGGMCQTSPREAEELRAESSWLLKEKLPTPKPNLTLEELRAIEKLKEYHSWVVFTAQQTRGWSWWLWTGKTTWTRLCPYCQTLKTYKTITKDPTTKLKLNFPKH